VTCAAEDNSNRSDTANISRRVFCYSMEALFDSGFLQSIAGARLLLVGVGGIGCEILKQLTVGPFTKIEIVHLTQEGRPGHDRDQQPEPPVLLPRSSRGPVQSEGRGRNRLKAEPQARDRRSPPEHHESPVRPGFFFEVQGGDLGSGQRRSSLVREQSVHGHQHAAPRSRHPRVPWTGRLPSRRPWS